jgi:hypothetical protein
MIGVLLFLVCCLVGLTVLFEAMFYAEEQQL